jgi:hypothetical protein
MVQDQRVQLSQDARPCSYQLSAALVAVDAAGGDRTVQIAASSPQCRWTAASDVSWIAISSAREGNGNGAVTFKVEPLAGQARTGTVTIGGQVLRVEQGAGCAVSITTTTFSFDAGGGRGEVPVAAPPGCPWSAQSQVPWIAILGGGTGTGPGTVVFQVVASSAARTGTLTISGQVVTVTQSQPQPCSFTVAPSSYSAPMGGGSTTFTVGTTAGCAWTASSAASWITIAGGQSGNGPGEVVIAVAANTGAARTGSLTIAGRTVTVTQSTGCTVTLTPPGASVGADASTGTVQVADGAGCSWTATTATPWIAITDGAAGSGNGQVRYAITANTGPARQGSIAIGGQTFAVSQASGCSYSIAPASQDVPGASGFGTVAVTTAAGCGWTAGNNPEWIALSSGSGVGPGQLSFTVAPNLAPARAGTFTVAGQTFTVRQASVCTWTFVPPSHSFDANGGNGNILVIVSGPCTWTAVSDVPWLTITAVDASIGGGLVQFVAAPNPGAARTGTLTIGGERYEVVQAAR